MHNILKMARKLFEVTPDNRLTPTTGEVVQWAAATGLCRKVGGDPENQVDLMAARAEILRIAHIPGHRDPLIRRCSLLSKTNPN